MLVAENISWQYPDGFTAIDHISLSVQKNESVGLVGANGAGKSTLLELLAGIKQDTDSGFLSLSGLSYEKKNLVELRKRIGYIFQNPDDQVFMPTVYDDIAFGIRNFGHDESFVTKRVDIVLSKLHIEHLKEKATYKLSGGEKRSVALAGVLVMEPDLILLDEPTTFLDLKGRRNLIHILSHISSAKIIATHDLEMILELCSRVIIMDHGKIAADGDPHELFRQQDFMEKLNLEIPASFSVK